MTKNTSTDSYGNPLLLICSTGFSSGSNTIYENNGTCGEYTQVDGLTDTVCASNFNTC